MIALGVVSALLAFIVVVRGEQCPDIYRRFSSQHSFCLSPNPQCRIKSTGVNAQEKELILRTHNEYRSKVARGLEPRAGGMPSSSNMLEMVWDDELAEIAQRWTKHCIYKHDCGSCRRVRSFSVGQNIGIGYVSGDRAGWKDFLDALYNEVQFFHKSKISSYVGGPAGGHPKQYGHFTQMVWADSWRVGCGWTSFDAGTGTKSYLACNYGPSGNVLHTKMYLQGQACSACPTNTCCEGSCAQHKLVANYKGLCKVINPALPPEPKDTRHYLFKCNFLNIGPNSDCATSKSNNLWTLTQTPGGNWQGVVLKAGQSTRLSFTKKIKSPGLICLYMMARGGPNVAESEFGLKVNTIIKNNGYENSIDTASSFKRLTNDHRQAFMAHTYQLQLSGDIEVSYDVSVLEGYPEQFFEIKSVAVTEAVGGSCPKQL